MKLDRPVKPAAEREGLLERKIFTLSPEKQARITNAALEVFARNDYKHASTDDIAAKAGISKGLLFYYFRNKQSLYLYLYDYALEQVRGRCCGRSWTA